jgi:putative nucleotidyltransferase with HDIG domain
MPGHLWLFAGSFAAAVAASISATLMLPAPAHPSTRIALLLLLLVVAGELTRHELYSDASTSIELIPILASGLLLAPAAVPVTVALVTFGQDAVRRRLRLATVFNFATVTLGALGALAAFRLLEHVGLASGWGALGAGLVAGGVYFAIGAPPIAFAEALELRRSTVRLFRERYAWLLPHYAVHGLLAAGLVVAARALGGLGVAVFSMPAIAVTLTTAQYMRRTRVVVADLEAANATLEHLLVENRDLLDSLGEQHIAVVRGLARAIDAKDAYTAGHTERVSRYAVLLAAELGLSESEQDAIEHGALLHDIGKIGVSDATLRKRGPLDPQEWQEIRRHPEIACFILEGIDLPRPVMDIVRSHHENLDGTGYPDALTADELSLEARIARVADAFDAMTSDRPYRRGLPLSVACEELRKGTGTEFCGEVVVAMERLIERGVVGVSSDAQRIAA